MPAGPPPLPDSVGAAQDEGEYTYEAFISYRHVEPDRTWAKWLHTALETYRVPKRLMRDHGLPSRLKRVFRDEDELPASADLSQEIEKALQQSRFLIVVCSPRTPESEWVNKEAVRFREMGRGDRILALLIEGEPSESFPRALREVRRMVTKGTGLTREEIEEVEPLAADVRPIRKESLRQMRRMAKFRMLACILRIPFDALRQREAERRRWRVLSYGCLAIALAVLFGALAASTARQQITSATREKELRNLRGHDADRLAIKDELTRRANAPTLAYTPVQWADKPSEKANQIRVRRTQLEEQLKEYNCAEVVIRSPLRNTMPPLNVLPAALRDMLREAVAHPTSATIPDSFMLKGCLTGVRTDGRRLWLRLAPSEAEWPFPQLRRPIRLMASGPVPELANMVYVEFENPHHTLLLSDFLLGDKVSVAVKRVDWNEFNLPDMSCCRAIGGSITELPDGLGLPLVRPNRDATHGLILCFKGLAVGKVEDPLAWLDASLGRERILANEAQLKSAPSLMERSSGWWSGGKALIVAKLDNIRYYNDEVCINADIVDRGNRMHAFPVMINMGPSARVEEFGDYQHGDTLSALVDIRRVTLDGSSPAGMPGFPIDLRMRSGLERRASTAYGSTSAGAPWLAEVAKAYNRNCKAQANLFAQGQMATTLKADWVQVENRPETVVLTTGPRRSGVVARDGAITPELAYTIAKQCVNQRVVWSGTLASVGVYSNSTVCSVNFQKKYGKNWVSPTFCAFSRDSTLVSQLSDYRSDEEDGYGKGDLVRITGTLRPPAACEGLSDWKDLVVEIIEMQRGGNVNSLVTVGTTRASSTFQDDRVISQTEALFRGIPPAGSVVTIVCEYRGISSLPLEVRVGPVRSKSDSYTRNISMTFESAKHADFSDYVIGDVVECSGIVVAKRFMGQCALVGRSIVRVGNPLSRVTNEGRAVPIRDFSAQRKRWEALYQQGQTVAATVGETILMGGAFAGWSSNETHCVVGYDRLFYTGQRLEVKCAPPSEKTKQFLNELKRGVEVLFEVVVGDARTSPPKIYLSWMAPIGEPDARVTFDPPPEPKPVKVAETVGSAAILASPVERPQKTVVSNVTSHASENVSVKLEYVCIREIVAWHPKNSLQPIGKFQANTRLIVGDKDPYSGMYHVIYRQPNGQEIHALCKPEDVGRQ